MSKKHLLDKPHEIIKSSCSKSSWWYEENNGIMICVDPNTDLTMHLIPWRSIRNALARKDKK